MDNWLVSLIVAATLAVFSSLLVVLTPILFPRMRSKLFQQIVCFISIGDIIGNIAYVFPYRPQTGNPGCDIEAFFNYAGYPMEWMWTTALAYLLHELAVRGRVPRSMVPIHIVCWGVPIALALLTLAFSKYVKNTTSYEVCRMHVSTIPLTYHIVSYYGLFFLCMVVMFWLYLQIYRMELQKDARVLKMPFRVAKQALTWYPFAMALFWLPHAITAVSPSIKAVYPYFLILKVYHALAVSLLFFYQSVESRWLWYSTFVAPCLPGYVAFHLEWYICGFSANYRSHRALSYVGEHRQTEFSVSSPVAGGRSFLEPATVLSSNVHRVDKDFEDNAATSRRADAPYRPSVNDDSRLICIDDILDMIMQEEDVASVVSKDRDSAQSFRISHFFGGSAHAAQQSSTTDAFATSGTRGSEVQLASTRGATDTNPLHRAHHDIDF